MLQTNCFKLADALCLYSADKMATMNAAGYLVLSGRPIHDVIQYIMNKYPEVSMQQLYCTNEFFSLSDADSNSFYYSAKLSEFGSF